jgi:hypothetical protein
MGYLLLDIGFIDWSVVRVTVDFTSFVLSKKVWHPENQIFWKPNLNELGLVGSY